MALYSVTFLHNNGSVEFSCYRQTKKAARDWAKWLASKSYVSKAFVYEGNVGGNLIEEVAH